MRKVILITVFVLSGWMAQGQDQFVASGEIGLPIGDAGDFATFNFAVQMGYLFGVTESVQVGGKIGYSHSFGDEIDTFLGPIDLEDVQFLPIAAAGRYNFNEEFLFGLDLGYGVGLNDGNDGGFYYSPYFAYGISDQVDIFAAFRGISVDGGSWDVISVGVEFGFN